MKVLVVFHAGWVPWEEGECGKFGKERSWEHVNQDV